MEAVKEYSTDKKLSWKARLSYGCGDTACNVVYGMISTVLTFFYTDYVGISPVTVGLVMLLSRIFDGGSDVIMGLIVQKTNSRWGKSRPWVLWMSLPYTFAAVLLFTVPRTTNMLQFLYIFVTYNLCTTVCYTAINVPYGSLSAMMTRSSRERDMLSIVRMGMSPFGRILAVTCTLPLVKIFGDDQAAWIKTMTLWAFVALILLVICFRNCEEKVEVKQEQSSIKANKAFGALFRNQYFWACLVLWMMQNVIYTVTGTILPYYCKYVFHNDTLYSSLYLVETLVLVGVTFMSPFLVKRFGKRNISMMGIAFALIGHLAFFLNPGSFAWTLASCIIRGIGLAPLNSIIFGFLGDAVDFGHWKSGIRQESLVFAAGSVGAKVGGGFTSAIMTSLLSMAGYVSATSGSQMQPDSAIRMIMNIYKFGPLIVWIIIMITLYFYKLDKQYPRIMAELNEREYRKELDSNSRASEAPAAVIRDKSGNEHDRLLITISRQYGSGGREVARILARKLGIRYYDREIVCQAATKLGKTEREASTILAESYQIPQDKMSAADEWAFDTIPAYNQMYQQQSVVIMQIANRESAVFLGRCADAVLKDMPNHYSFFIYADQKFREERGPEFYNGMSFREMEKEEEARERYYNYYTGRKWGNPENYNLMINTSRMTLEEAADLILDYINKQRIQK
jgi:GPH family glycoside/pentoside/hexuronide:cation symporter